MDGGLRRMYSSVKWCAFYLHTHKYTHTSCIQACVACDGLVMKEKLLIWLYPNECNSVFSNWRQQDVPVFLPWPGTLHVPPAKRRPWPPVSSAGGELRIQTPSWVTEKPQQQPCLCVHALKRCPARCRRDKHNLLWCALRANTIFLLLYVVLLW